MCLIMKHLHKYVCAQYCKSHEITFLPGDVLVCENTFHHWILFGGDQLTVCHCRGAQLVCLHDDASEEHYTGLVPVIEDWHARMTLMRVIYYISYDCFVLVIWKHFLFNKKSSAEKDTLYQLRNVLNVSGVPIDLGDNMKGAKDFLLCELHSHIISVANNILS